MTQLVWFRNDLRLADNAALTAACKSAEPVEACFFVTPEQWRRHDWGAIRVEFVLENLSELGQGLAQRGIPLHIRHCPSFAEIDDELLALCRERQVHVVHFNDEYGINERRRDRRIHERLQSAEISCHKYRDQCAVPVGELLTQAGAPYTVFTPFSRRWRAWLDEHPRTLFPAPGPRANACAAPTTSEVDLSKVPYPPFPVPPGEAAAHGRLHRFLEEKAANYRRDRDHPALAATSVLSPYLACGVLSGKQCLVAALQRQAGEPGEGLAGWINELAWRDFYIHILYHFPQVSMHRAFRPETEQLRWNAPGAALTDWKHGQTGIPLVDAAMRQLKQTGWMHNRLRMVVAMFLTKNLFIDWRQGEAWFMQQLVDGFLASNNGGWQWSASTGTDAAPYFRVFNPIAQSERFDPEGEFIRHYVPELKDLDNRSIHDPTGRGKRPQNYPEAIVDVKESRKEAIARFKELGSIG